MAKTICPGQNMMFWRPEDIFEIDCGFCGSPVEFFRDEGSRRCRKCGKIVRNPKVNLGCAQWCEHARECLGYDPKDLDPGEAGRGSLADALVDAVKAEFDGDERRITHAFSVLDVAEQIMKKEGGDPRVVIAASLLHDIGIHEAEKKHGSSAAKYQEKEGPPIARRIMEDLGFDEETIEHVCRIVGSHHTGGDIDTPEFRIVWDADLIINAGGGDRLSRDNVLEKLRTDAGRELAFSLV